MVEAEEETEEEGGIEGNKGKDEEDMDKGRDGKDKGKGRNGKDWGKDE